MVRFADFRPLESDFRACRDLPRQGKAVGSRSRPQNSDGTRTGHWQSSQNVSDRYYWRSLGDSTPVFAVRGRYWPRALADTPRQLWSLPGWRTVPVARHPAGTAWRHIGGIAGDHLSHKNRLEELRPEGCLGTNERIGARCDVGAVLVTEARHDLASNLPCFFSTETSSERFWSPKWSRTRDHGSVLNGTDRHARRFSQYKSAKPRSTDVCQWQCLRPRLLKRPPRLL